MVTNSPRLTLMSRTYCHLCHDMEEQLKPLLAEFGVEVDVLDVDSDETLDLRWGELVPVLLYKEEELCHYFLDMPKVRDYLRQIR